jgi:hypothetical protein
LEGTARPEPTEQARYLIALSAPVLLVAATLLLAHSTPRRLAASATRLAGGVEVAAVAVVAGCFVAQRLQTPTKNAPDPPPIVYFTLASVIAAAAIAGALVAAVRSPRLHARVAAWTGETRGRRIGATLVALAALAVTLLPAFNTDASIGAAYEAVIYHLQFTYDETVAVLNGRSPLGDFATQYSSLWPYALAGGMSLLGDSLAVYTGLMATLTGIALLALYDVLRRLTRSSIGALLLFLPLLATCAFRLHGPEINRFSVINYFGVLPLRYAGPFLLAWLTARHLDGVRPRRLWPLFAAGGLVVLNNTDFGIAALGATVAALLWTRRPGAASPRRQLLEAAAGLVVAFALVTALLLVRTGSPPDLALPFLYARTFVVDGFAMLPIKPTIGFSTVIFLTHVAAIGVATVRAIRRDPDRLMTGLLAWSGIFGLGAGSYYVGHSLSEVLTYTFPCWALTVVLLTLLTLRALAAAAPRMPSAGQLACLFGFGLLVCSLAQTPAPWQQLDRLTASPPPVFAEPIGQAFVAERAQAGEAVLIMTGLGHRIAENLELEDVEAFTGGLSVLTVEQLDRSLAALRATGGRSVFVLPLEAYPGLRVALQQRGFTVGATDQQLGTEQWVAP